MPFDGAPGSSRCKLLLGPSAWVQWQRPVLASLLHIILVAPGGGGGGSGNGVNACSTPGGSGSISILTIPAASLPPILWFLLPDGGLGGLGAASTSGVSANNGVAGADAYIADSPLTAAQNTILRAGGGGAGSGIVGPNGGGGVGGAAPAASTMLYSAYGQRILLAGQAGAAGAATSAAGVSVTFGSTGIPVSGGASGANSTTLGGGTIIGGGPVANVPASSKGLWLPRYLMSTGGGGGAGTANTGGSGGDAGYGSGGGSGGVGSTIGGNGGKGGPAFAFAAWS